MKARHLLFVTLALGAGCRAPSGGIAEDALNTRALVTTLASDAMQGRVTGSAGERRAGDYIIAQLERIGAKPLPGRSDYRMPFEFTAGARDGGSSMTVQSNSAEPQRFDSRSDIQALSFSDQGSVTEGIVFAGYGIVVPPGQEIDYDSYAGLDVKDKIVLVLRYFPENAERNRKALLARYADLRHKARAARDRGAKGMLVVAGPGSPNAGAIIPMTFDSAIAGSGIIAASISDRVASVLFANSGHTLADAQRALDSGDASVPGFELPKVKTTIATSVIREKRTGSNILAYLPATSRPDVSKPWIVLGAHYDHLGNGQAGTSLAGKDEAGRVHPGADDNASGVAAVIAAGRALARDGRQRNVLLAFWSGEEIGLLGSAAFVAAPPVLRSLPISISTWSAACRTTSSSFRRRGRAMPGGACSNAPTSPQDSISSCRTIRISRPTSQRSTTPVCRASASSPARTATIIARPIRRTRSTIATSIASQPSARTSRHASMLSRPRLCS
jgi:hypothetical protein